MPNILSDVNKRALAELLDNYNALPWYKKWFYPSALSAALRQYREAPSYDLVVTVHNACLKKTWFFQRWLFPLLVSFSSSSLGANLETPNEEQLLPGDTAQSTPELITALPGEMVLNIGKTLRLKDKARLARTSKYYYGLFKPELRAAKLLLLVVQGQQDEAHAMLGQYPELLLKQVDVTDYSGRTFIKISAYEYAYWAKDTHMCRMLEPHMDDTKKAAMLGRINKMERVGLTYEQQGVVITDSKHFDFTPLITALRGYVDGFDNWYATGNWGTMRAALRQVGMAQRDMPVHVVNEYCRPDRSFYPRPEFNEGDLPRSVKFYNSNTQSKQAFFPLGISHSLGLGIDFALARDGKLCSVGIRAGSSPDVVSIDLAAISHLDEIRTVDLTRLRESLLPTDLEPSHSMRV